MPFRYVRKPVSAMPGKNVARKIVAFPLSSKRDDVKRGEVALRDGNAIENETFVIVGNVTDQNHLRQFD